MNNTETIISRVILAYAVFALAGCETYNTLSRGGVRFNHSVKKRNMMGQRPDYRAPASLASVVPMATPSPHAKSAPVDSAGATTTRALPAIATTKSDQATRPARLKNPAAKTYQEARGAQKILYIGDSHSYGKYGEQVYEHLKDGGKNQVEFHAVCGSQPRDWIGGPTNDCGYRRNERKIKTDNSKVPSVEALLANSDVDVVYIQQGSNQLTGATANAQQTEDKFYRDIMELKARVLGDNPNRECVWIGPPDSRESNETGNKPYRIQAGATELYYRALDRALGQQCRIVDSRLAGRYPDNLSDGLHLSGPVQQSWIELTKNQIDLQNQSQAHYAANDEGRKNIH